MRFTLKETESSQPALAAIAAKFSRRKPLNAALGKRAEVELRDHFLRRNQEPNASGWRKQNFWSRIRRATAYVSADDDAARVVISDPAIAQKIHGGTIRPREKKFLAIAAIAEAYGKSPREFDFLHVRRFKGSGALALVEADRTIIGIGKTRKDGTRKVKDKGQAQRGRVWYWLARSVTQKADARALPDDAHMQDALLDEAMRLLVRR